MEELYLSRGIRVDNGEWGRGRSLWNGNIAGGYEEEYVEFEVHSFTIGRCTGLTTENGTWIYGGDILENACGLRGEVKWDLDCWVVSFDGIISHDLAENQEQRTIRLSYFLELGATIAGDIYHSPEFLELPKSCVECHLLITEHVKAGAGVWLKPVYKCHARKSAGNVSELISNPETECASFCPRGQTRS